MRLGKTTQLALTELRSQEECLPLIDLFRTSVDQVVIVHCRILAVMYRDYQHVRYTIVHCRILAVMYRDYQHVRYTIVHCGILWYIVVYCGILWYTVMYCDVPMCMISLAGHEVC